MAVAKFGADVTGAYEAQNFVRPQEGIQDGSAETLLKTAASATQQGYQLTAAFKAKEFRGELDSAVNQEIGKQMLATQEAQPSDTEEFKSAIERAKQVYAQGGAGAKTRTSLLAEKLTREKAGANPLFAKVYRQVAEEVLGDYDATLQFMTAAEEAAAKKAQSEAEIDKDLTSSVYRMHERAKGSLPFIKPPEMMTHQEKMEYIVAASKIAQNREDEERKRQAAMDGLRFRQVAAQEAGAASQIQAANIGLDEADAQRDEVSYLGIVRNNFFSEMGTAIQRELLGPIANGSLDTSTPQAKQIALGRIGKMRVEFTQRINAMPVTTPGGRAERDALFRDMETAFSQVQEFYTGPMSSQAAVADLSNKLNAQLGIDSHYLSSDLMLLNKTFGPSVMGIFAQDALLRDKGKTGGPVANMRARYDAAMNSVFSNDSRRSLEQGGSLTGISEENANVLRRSSIDILRSNNPSISSLNSDPEAWRINTMRGLDNIEIRGPTLSTDERSFLLEGLMTRNFVQNYNSLKNSNPSEAERIAYRYHEAARHVLPSAIGAIQKKAADNIYINPENGYFITDLPDQRVKTLVNQINSVLDGLVATKSQDLTAPTDDDEARLYFIEEFFR